MRTSITEVIKDLVANISDGDVVKKHTPSPNVKPPRRRPSVQNKTDKTDYSKNYMKEYREDGKDFQKAPDAIKELKRKQQKALKEKFGL
jgi:hypothetical protein